MNREELTEKHQSAMDHHAWIQIEADADPENDELYEAVHRAWRRVLALRARLENS